MQDNPLISIIVPVYNAEKYIDKCIESILGQTFTDFELLLIDDGSPDKSGDICDKYALEDNRIIVIHKLNGGVSSARQCGLINSKGEYVIHVDPDDWIEANMLEELYNIASLQKSDMVICDFYVEHLNPKKTVYIQQKPSLLRHDIVLMDLFCHLHGSCCNKLIKRSYFSKYKIEFPIELSFCEDLYVNVSLLKYDMNISYLPCAFYHYVQDANSNSLVKTYSDKVLHHDINMKELFLKLLKNHKAYSLCEEKMVFLIVKRAFDSSQYSSSKFKYLFSKYHNCIKRNKNINISFKCVLLLSCNGLYQQIKWLLKIIIRIKRYI